MRARAGARLKVALLGRLSLAGIERRQRADRLRAQLQLGIAAGEIVRKTSSWSEPPGTVAPCRRIGTIEQGPSAFASGRLPRFQNQEIGVAELVAAVPERHLRPHGGAEMIDRRKFDPGRAERQRRVGMVMADRRASGRAW